MADIRCPVSEAADTSRHEPALITQTRKIIYSEYDQYVGATAARLRQAGCADGARVAVSLPNDWQHAVILMALFRARSVACLLDPRLPRAAIDRWRQELGCGRFISSAGAGEALDPADLVVLFGEGAAEERPCLASDQPATILVRGDGAGARAVLHDYGSHYYSARGANHNIRASSHTRWLLSQPFSDPAGLGLLLRCAFNAATLVTPDEDEPVAESIPAYEITHLSLTLRQLEGLLAAGFNARAYEQLQAVLVVEPVPQDVLRRALDREFPVYASYGLAEMASQVTAVGPETPAAGRETAGPALRYREVRISGEGEIMVRGPTLFTGYVEGSSVRRPTDAEGWFATGDLGRLDEAGCLTVLGRKPAA